MSPTLPPGFISIDDAVELIKSDTRENPVVDMDYLAAHKVWLDRNGPAHNFRIPKIRMLKPEEVYKTKRGKIVDYEHTGDVYVQINTAFENELLKKTIMDKYKELVGHEYKELVTRGMSTVADDAEGRNAVTPRARKTTMAQEGQSIGSGEVVSTNGQGLEV